MKKLSILLGVAALLMTACSNDEVIDTSRSPAIGFDTFVDNSTRALESDDLSGTTLTNFAVWGVSWHPGNNAVPSSQFFGTKVEKREGAWVYEPLRFWAEGDSYRFSAIAPYIDRGDGSSISVVQNTDEISDFDAVKGGITVTFDNSIAQANTDLCYAWNKLQSASASQSPVSLVFSHMLSRVKFTFINGFPSMLQAIKITDIKIQDATSKATIDKVNGDELWTDVSNATTFVIPFAMQPRQGVLGDEKDYILGGQSTPEQEPEGGRLAHNRQESDHHYIFPLNGEKAYRVTFSVQLFTYNVGPDGAQTFAEGDIYSHDVTLPSIEYKNNFSYNFIATIDQNNVNPESPLNPIVFNPSVSEWSDFGDNNVTLQNGGS